MHNAEKAAENAHWLDAVTQVFPPIPLDAPVGFQPRSTHTTKQKKKKTKKRPRRGDRLQRVPEQNMRHSSSTPMLPSAPGAMAIIKRGGSQTSLDKRQRHGEKGWVNPATEDEYDEEEEDKDESADFYTKLTDRETFLFLNNQTSNVSLDLSDNTNIDSPVLWQAAIELAKTCKSVNLRGNANLNDVMMRSLALCLGESLEAIDAAGCPTMDDAVVSSLVIRLFNLRYINLSNCKLITNNALKALADGCKATLTSIDVSKCKQIGDTGIAWIAGAVGSGQACKKLMSFNLEDCVKIRDRSLEDLGNGCHSLRFVNFRGCTEISNRGIKSLANGCHQLSIVNIHSCLKVGDSGLVALGKHCPELQSLCATRCSTIGDRGLTAIGKGCPKLQSITLAGCVKITEGGICAIAENCQGLQTLNVTGCIDVTENGLKELLRGLPFVEKALTYVGFRPKGSSQSAVRHLRLSIQHKAVLDAAASRLQAMWVSYRCRKLLRAAQGANMLFKTSLRIQRMVRGARARVRVKKLKIEIYLNNTAKIIQIWYREQRQKLADWALNQSRLIYVTQVGAICKMQAMYRGLLVRRYFPDVVRVIHALRDERWVEAEEAVAVRLQTVVRLHRANRMMKALSEESSQRNRDEKWASREIERVIRGHFGRQQAYYIRRNNFRNQNIQYSNAGILAIQKRIRSKHKRLRLAGYRLRQTWAVQVDRINATTIQNTWRSCVARDLLKVLKSDNIIRTRAILKLQRIYRGHKVKGFKDIKFDMMRNRVRARYEQDAVRAEIVIAAKMKIVQNKRDNDSCSDSGEDDKEWKEYTDFDGSKFFFSAAKNIRRSERSEDNGWEFTLIGKRVRIFWPVEDKKFEAFITKYHVRKNKYRVEYDDNEHEWIDLRSEQDRVQVKEIYEDGTVQWIDFKFLRDPAKDKGRGVRGALKMGGGREEDDEDRIKREEKEAIAATEKLLEREQTLIDESNNDNTMTLMPGEEDEDEWVEYIDDTTGEPYYVNAVTGETRWELD
tara:strand:- start:89 stop:3121 length:3033 start_codon:yes stop_codon:yes gene_type:complete